MDLGGEERRRLRARQIVLPSVDEIMRKQQMDFFGEPALVGTPQDVIDQIEEYRSRSRLTHLVCAMLCRGHGRRPDPFRHGAFRAARHPALSAILTITG